MTTSFEGLLVPEHISFPLVDGTVYTTKRSTADIVQISSEDSTAAGTANFVGFTKSGRTITLSVTGVSGGTANVTIWGRL